MPAIRHIAVTVAIICLTCVAAMGFESMTAAIRVSSGNLYDYVVIGEHPQATDGFDNVYDTISPGNLNAVMGQPFISVIIPHPEWKSAMREMRGDIRSLAKQQQWNLDITSSLPEGTPLTVALQTDGTNLPQGVNLTLKDCKKVIDLKAGDYMLPAPGPGTKARILINTEQL